MKPRARPASAARLARSLALTAATAFAATALGAPAARSLTFEQVFSDRHEPAALHFEASYVVAGQPHRLELWRRGATNLRRSTDGRIDSYIVRSPGDAEYRMTVLDRQRNLATRIDRSNLYRIGSFTDWFDLAHGLRHPATSYQLLKIATPTDAIAPIARCRWYALRSEGHESRICWSTRYRVPLLIDTPGQPQPAWRVTTISTQPIATAEFAFDDSSFLRNDANRDLERD